jgi:hypothetical protein
MNIDIGNLKHLLRIDLGKGFMSAVKECNVEANLRQKTEDVNFSLEVSDSNLSASSEEARSVLLAARTAWDWHRATCPICTRRLLN